LCPPHRIREPRVDTYLGLCYGPRRVWWLIEDTAADNREEECQGSAPTLCLWRYGLAGGGVGGGRASP